MCEFRIVTNFSYLFFDADAMLNLSGSGALDVSKVSFDNEMNDCSAE